MPIPFIVAAASAVAAVVGAKAAVDGGKKMKEAKDTMLVAQSRHQKNMGAVRSRIERPPLRWIDWANMR